MGARGQGQPACGEEISWCQIDYQSLLSIDRGMQGGDESSASLSAAPSTVDAAPATSDIARQLLNTDRASEGGILSQLTSNPFFTAVRSKGFIHRSVLNLLGIWTCRSRSSCSVCSSRRSPWRRSSSSPASRRRRNQCTRRLLSMVPTLDDSASKSATSYSSPRAEPANSFAFKQYRRAGVIVKEIHTWDATFVY